MASRYSGKSRDKWRVAEIFFRLSRLDASIVDDKHVPIAANASDRTVFLSDISEVESVRPFAHIIWKTRLRCRALWKLPASKIDFRTSAPRFARAASLTETMPDSGSPDCIGTSSWPHLPQSVDQTKRQWRKTRSGVCAVHLGQYWKLPSATYRTHKRLPSGSNIAANPSGSR